MRKKYSYSYKSKKHLKTTRVGHQPKKKIEEEEGGGRGRRGGRGGKMRMEGSYTETADNASQGAVPSQVTVGTTVL